MTGAFVYGVLALVNVLLLSGVVTNYEGWGDWAAELAVEGARKIAGYPLDSFQGWVVASLTLAVLMVVLLYLAWHSYMSEATLS